MNYNTVYVGMDVHKESFTLCSMTIEDEKASHYQKTEADYKKVLKYLEFLRTIYGGNAKFICGYEAGCLGFTLYHQLTSQHVECIILAPTTMLEQRSKKRIKTDKRDAEIIAKCLAQHNYSPVHIPTATDEQVKEFLRMRDDHKLALKKIKQQINAFCLRHGYIYGGHKWSIKHLEWLKKLDLSELNRETLNEYMTSYEEQTAKIERFDKRIEELAADSDYHENVRKLSCLLGIQTYTALSLIVETGDFKRFRKGNTYAAFLGLAPGESSSGEKISRTGITKAGNSRLRTLLIEAATGICKGKVGHKSKALCARQAGNPAEVIAYADRGNIRMRSKYKRMIRHEKKRNVAVAAIARELACYVWGIMTNHIEPREEGKKAA